MSNQETEQKRLIQELRHRDEENFRNNPTDKRLHRALERLSKDLYSKESHFIFELIQNAEDNNYNENASPSLSFTIYPPDNYEDSLLNNGFLIVINNEIGFQEANVRALCDVGDSTKKGKEQGYIGEKGIGFKSVFMVSAQPYIFSNGYHFKFNEKPDPTTNLGFIVPAWIDQVPSFLQDLLDETVILLPFKPNKYSQVVKEIKDIRPETILFLTKLRELCVQMGKEILINVFRNDSHKPIIELEDGEDEENNAAYWIKEKDFSVPSEINEEKRKEINSRRVSIALPTKKSNQFKSTDSVFAYLPTEENSGLPFLVNADFILGSSREKILQNLEWNTWLRDCIAPTFVEAFEEMLRDEHNKFDAYRFLPIEPQQNNSFFEPIKAQILNLLKEKPDLIWVITADGEETLKSATQVRRATPAVRKLLNSAKALPAYFNQISLVHPKIEQHFKQLKVLGVELLSENEILEFLKDEEWLSQQSPSWFLELYKFLNTQTYAKHDNLKKCPILLLDDGTLTAPINQSVYLPVKEDIAKVAEISKQLETTQLKLALLNQIIFASVKNDVEILDYLQKYLLIKNLTLPNYSIELIKHLKGLEFSKVVIITKFIFATVHFLTTGAR